MAKLSHITNVETTRVNLGADEIIDAARALKGAYVKIGAQQGSGMHKSEDGAKKMIRLAQLLAIHEFGCPEKNIPERSVLRRTMFEKEYKYLVYAREMLKQVVHGQLEPEKLVALMGERIQADVQNEFGSPTLKANSPATIKRKGSDAPLIDTGQLRQAIRYVVVMAAKQIAEAA